MVSTCGTVISIVKTDIPPSARLSTVSGAAAACFGFAASGAMVTSWLSIRSHFRFSRHQRTEPLQLALAEEAIVVGRKHAKESRAFDQHVDRRHAAGAYGVAQVADQGSPVR